MAHGFTGKTILYGVDQIVGQPVSLPDGNLPAQWERHDKRYQSDGPLSETLLISGRWSAMEA